MKNPHGRTGAIGQGSLPVTGRNQIVFVFIIAENRVLSLQKSPENFSIPFHIINGDETSYLDELERKLKVKFHIIAYDMLLDHPLNTGEFQSAH